MDYNKLWIERIVVENSKLKICEKSLATRRPGTFIDTWLAHARLTRDEPLDMMQSKSINKEDYQNKHICHSISEGTLDSRKATGSKSINYQNIS